MEYTLQDLENNSNTPIDFAQWMGNEEFLRVNGRLCRICGSMMILGESSHFVLDGVCLRCPNQLCRNTTSVRDGIFFSQSQLSLRKQMQIIISFAADSTVSDTARLFSVSRPAVTN